MTINKDMNLTAVWKDYVAVEYTLTIYPYNGDEAYTEEVLKGEAYAPEINADKYPDNAVSYELYTDDAFTKPLAVYLKDNNGFAGDIDIYVKWAYEGEWVEVIAHMQEDMSPLHHRETIVLVQQKIKSAKKPEEEVVNFTN